MGRWCSRNIKHQVRMLKHVRTNSMAQSNQEQLRAFTPRKFHRWHEVAIARHEHEDIGMSIEGNRRNVQPEAHIHTLLLNVRFEIRRSESHACVLLRQSFPVEPSSRKKQDHHGEGKHHAARSATAFCRVHLELKGPFSTFNE
jgi:hypothetical protein